MGIKIIIAAVILIPLGVNMVVSSITELKQSVQIRERYDKNISYEEVFNHD